MRICLVAHGFPPEERTGVETYTASLAGSFAAAGHQVEVFAACPDPQLADLAMRRTVVTAGEASYGVTRIATNSTPRGPEEMLDPPGIAVRFASFLERERPEVVHFQHVIKLGLGLIEVASAAGIPTLYTHHDYYGCCHRYTFLRPDLAVCERPQDTEACARCDVALGLLNSVEGLGDYQMGVAPSALDTKVRAKLAGLLDGDPVADGGLAPGELEVAMKHRESLDARRSEAFGQIGQRISPSNFLAKKLEATGMGKVDVIGYGIDCTDLLPLRTSAPVTAPAPGKPLRILYIGSFVKQKGVEVLIDAFRDLRSSPEAGQRPRLELTLRGYASDAKWVDELEKRAREAGATFPGGYQRDELPSILAQADVVVVPSTWFENYPIAIREAFAAGRPVLTSRLGALEESVSDNVDGLLFEAGDSADLAKALGRLLDEPRLLETLVAGIGDLCTVDDHARELFALYEAKVSRVEPENLSDAPSHMRPFLERCSQLEGTASRELFRGVLRDLARLAEKLGVDPGDVQASAVLERAFSTGDEAQRQLRDFKRESSWLRESLDAASTSGESQENRMAWLEETMLGRDATITSLEAEREEQRAASVALSEKTKWLEEGLSDKDKELTWLRETVAGLTGERDSLVGERDSLVGERDSLAGALEGLRSQSDELEAQLSELQGGFAEAKENYAALEQLLHERLHQVAETGLLALQGQEHAMVSGLVPLFEALDKASGLGEDPSLSKIEDGLDHLVGAVQLGLKNLRMVEKDLEGRKREMLLLADEAARPLLKFLLSRTDVGKRLERWREGGLVEGEEGSS